MTGEKDLGDLLASLAPRLMDGDYVFCTLDKAKYGDFAELLPLASFREAEGLTLLITKEKADQAGFTYESKFKGIVLSVHSRLIDK